MKYDSDEYRKLEEERLAAGRAINPATAVLATWCVGTMDPYGDGFELSPDQVNISREIFVRDPEGDWVLIDDLPEALREEIWRRRADARDADAAELPECPF
jgi:hypothetical protein